MAVVTGDSRQRMLATPELKLLGFLLVAGEADLRPGLGRFVAKGHQSSHPLATTSGHVRFARAMTGLAPPMRRGLWGGLLEEFGMGSGTKIFRQIGMASHTDLRPDIATLLLLGRGGPLLPTDEAPSHPRADECYQQEDYAIAWHPLSFPAPLPGPERHVPGRAVAP